VFCCALSALGGCGGEEIWTEDSQAVEIEWWSFFDGAYLFARERSQLSPRQRALLSQVRTVVEDDDCWDDVPGVTVRVRHLDGTTREFRAAEHGCDEHGKEVDYEDVADLLDTVDCLASKRYDASSLAVAPTFVPGDGCRHGLLNSAFTAADYWFRVDVEKAARYRVALEQCHARTLSVELLDESGETTLASAEGADECPVLEHELEAGTYALRVTLHDARTGGDFFLGVDPVD
jgi:hypothetical protein